MKYVLLIGDGMGDYPRPELNDRTPLAAAPTPNLDALAKGGMLGLARTVPEGMAPGSDVAIMSLMGYNPQGVLSGRGPLEALAQGLELEPDDVAFRLNLVTLEIGLDLVSMRIAPEVKMRNHAAGNITTGEARELIESLRKRLPLNDGQRLAAGVSYRHLLIWPGLKAEMPSLPPHDYRDQAIDKFLDDPAAKPIMDLVRASWHILAEHPVNVRRRQNQLPPANSIWLWGQGRKPAVKSYKERWGLSGAAVSAVDLIKGLGLATGLAPLEVPGATGWLDTNYQGKVEAALAALKTVDFVVLHVEAPDEASHQGELDSKMTAIADFDEKVVGPVMRALPEFGEYRVLAACDHFTPLALKTHTGDPVPFVINGSGIEQKSGRPYTEAEAEAAGLKADSGEELGRLFFGPELESAHVG